MLRVDRDDVKKLLREARAPIAGATGSSSSDPLRRRAMAFALLASFALAAHAADPLDPLGKREPARPGYLPGNPNDPFALPQVERAPGKAPSDGSGGRVIQRVVFQGNSAISTAELNAWRRRTLIAG
jgi:hypothetical protein